MDYNFWKNFKGFVSGHNTLFGFIFGSFFILFIWLIITGAGGIVEKVSGDVWDSSFLKIQFQLRYIIIASTLIAFITFSIGIGVGRKYASFKRTESVELDTEGYLLETTIIPVSVLEIELWKFQREQISLDDFATFMLDGLNNNHIRLDDARHYLNKVDHDVQKLNSKYVLTPKT